MSHQALAEELREYTAMKYAGNCKCGKCQLVPRELIERIYHALNAASQMTEGVRATAAPVAPEPGWLAPALDKAAQRAAEMPEWMTRAKPQPVAASVVEALESARAQLITLGGDARLADQESADRIQAFVLHQIDAALTAARDTKTTILETTKCILCSKVESPGFYFGCMIKDGHACDGWQCDGNGNLSRKK